MAKGDETATLEQLETEFRSLADQVDAASARRLELHGLIKQRRAEAGARVKVDGMHPLEREALKKVLNEES